MLPVDHPVVRVVPVDIWAGSYVVFATVRLNWSACPSSARPEDLTWDEGTLCEPVASPITKSAPLSAVSA